MTTASYPTTNPAAHRADTSRRDRVRARRIQQAARAIVWTALGFITITAAWLTLILLTAALEGIAR